MNRLYFSFKNVIFKNIVGMWCFIYKYGYRNKYSKLGFFDKPSKNKNFI